MRARVSGSTITAHGDTLGVPYVEFYGNEPLGFGTNWTVSGSSPTRVLVDPHGHEFSRELPTQTMPAPVPNPSTGDDGDVIQVATGAYTLGAVTEGGVQTVTRLGPFPITHQTTDIQNDSAPAVIGAVPDGSAVIRVWAIPVVSWDEAASADDLLVLEIGGGGGGTAVTRYALWDFGSSSPSDARQREEVPTYTRIVMANTGQSIRAWLSGPNVGTGHALTAGAADIYALVATAA